MDLDRAKHEEEKVKLLEKMFSCAETPIKEWLAEIKNVDVEEMFPDFVDENEQKMKSKKNPKNRHAVSIFFPWQPSLTSIIVHN